MAFLRAVAYLIIIQNGKSGGSPIGLGFFDPDEKIGGTILGNFREVEEIPILRPDRVAQLQGQGNSNLFERRTGLAVPPSSVENNGLASTIDAPFKLRFLKRLAELIEIGQERFFHESLFVHCLAVALRQFRKASFTLLGGQFFAKSLSNIIVNRDGRGQHLLNLLKQCVGNINLGH
jgi:hypothetical protein